MVRRNPLFVTGAPDWGRAQEVANSLLQLPAGVDEEEIRSRIRELLGRLFPKLKYPEIATQFNTGDGPADVVCRNLVVEVKSEGRMHAPRHNPDGSFETPEEQLERYLTAIHNRPDMFYKPGDGWHGLVADGRKWDFYRFNPDAPPKSRLEFEATRLLEETSDIDGILIGLHDIIDKVSKIAPPTHDGTWAAEMVKGFVDLATKVSVSDSFQMKLTLWRDMLEGAFITSPDSGDSEVRLFASHTMLVVAARAVSNVLRPTRIENEDREVRNAELAKGFAAWLLDIGGAAGEKLIDEMVSEVNRYEWRRSDRDNLKDLYHAVIPRDIRHDFGEYYTPDWLARAVCEEVLDAEWRAGVVDAAVAGTIVGPAVLDPSCGSGTFLYHASKLLLETAAEHPALSASPVEQARVVNNLVAGMDLHPVAVELAKTTKALAFASEVETRLPDELGVFLGDSLQWSLKTEHAQAINGNVVELPTADAEDPIRLPYAMVLSDRFLQLLEEMFDLAKDKDDPQAETELLALLDLRSDFDRKTVVKEFHRFQEYIQTGRNHVWQWYIENLVQPIRLAKRPMTRLIGNPPWVVYSKMTSDRRGKLLAHATDRNVWAPAKLKPHNDLAATFVATCVDEYLAPGGRFGFVMPYATLRARHWERFRTGEWSSRSSDKTTKADLSAPAWDMKRVKEPPFPHVQSSVLFGTKVNSKPQRKSAKPLKLILRASGDGVDNAMGWSEVKPILEWAQATAWPIRPSDEYAKRFRQGAILSPKPLVVFDESDATTDFRGRVHFKTNYGKDRWQGLHREGIVEQRFVLSATFSQHLVPFGTTGHLNVIAPVGDDGAHLMRQLPTGEESADFRLYWSRAERVYRRTRSDTSAPDLLSQIDSWSKLSARLSVVDKPFVCYNAAGSWLSSAVVEAGSVVDSTLYWMSSDDEDELHYLAAILNAPALMTFFRECQGSDRHFHTGPIRSLPIPAFNADDANHQQLVKASRAAHKRVAGLAEVKRLTILADRSVRWHLKRIDDAVLSMLPDYCTTA